MRNSRVMRIGFFVTVLLLPTLLNFSAPVSSSSRPVFSGAVSATKQAEPPPVPAAQTVRGNSTYYTVRADVRRCASPMCGGFFIKRVNHARTRCANGRNMAECYVAEINWNGQPPVESGHALLRGELSQRRYPRLGRFGVLRVIESWRAMSERPPEGTFFRV